jgi:carboxymethylenebutenolidase
MGKTVTLKAADGNIFDAYRAEPAGKPRAGLVVIQEIFGLNSHIRAVTDAFAAQGYLAVAPALFDRVGKGIELGYEAADVAAGRDIRGKISWEDAMKDVAASMDAAKEAGKVGVVGYCWGGSLAWLAATRFKPAASVC